ncbi:MAG TPA: hypothetical protein VFK90_09920, partial [Anaeromyxobacter sp.]|nr:hypothetical protein [Anaeromyxobacter sp.]
MRAPQKRRPRAGRSRSETLQGARASAEQPSEAILSKYGALRAKHEDLLLRYSALVRSRTGIASVAFTAFRGPQPLALVRQGL